MRSDRPWCTISAAAIVAVVVIALAAAPAAAQAGAAPPTAAPSTAAAPLRVADLGWLAGTWEGTMGGDPIAEHWSAPVGGEMVGLFRWRRERPLYEVIVIEDTPAGAVMRLRHFGPNLVAWEEKDGAVVFRAVEHGHCSAVFAEEDDAEEQTRVRYAREADGGLLIQVLEERDGAESSLDFRFRPVGAPTAAPGRGGSGGAAG
jgi:hypothetical protein